MKTGSYTCPIVLDSDGHECIEFSDELMEHLNLKVGDTLVWEQLVTGDWSLRKQDGNKDSK